MILHLAKESLRFQKLRVRKKLFCRSIVVIAHCERTEALTIVVSYRNTYAKRNIANAIAVAEKGFANAAAVATKTVTLYTDTLYIG